MQYKTKLTLTALAAALALAACKQETSAPAASGAQGSAPAAASAPAQDPSALGTPEQQVSYAIGMDIGRNIKNMKDQGVNIDLDKFSEAVRAVAERVLAQRR